MTALDLLFCSYTRQQENLLGKHILSMKGLYDFFFKPNQQNNEEQKRDDPAKKQRLALEKEFANTTSCQGVYFWVNSKNNAQRLFWIFIVLGKST